MRLVVCGNREGGGSYVKYDGVPQSIKRLDTGEILSAFPDVLDDGQRVGALLVGPPDLQPANIGFSFDGERLDSLDLALGAVRWMVARSGPNVYYPMHRTATLDLDIVISGTLTIELDEAETELFPGDAVIIPGSRHAWRTGSTGATASYAMLGLIR
jgi:hypothetical protein